jgi:hypothetical protein
LRTRPEFAVLTEHRINLCEDLSLEWHYSNHAISREITPHSDSHRYRTRGTRVVANSEAWPRRSRLTSSKARSRVGRMPPASRPPAKPGSQRGRRRTGAVSRFAWANTRRKNPCATASGTTQW